MREPFLPQLDAWEFHHWEDRQLDKHELHHGFVVAFAGGTIDHDTLAINLCVAMRKAFPAPCRVFGSGVKVQISDSTVYYADAGVIYDQVRGDATVIATPTVVCEVPSESTRAYDLVEKRAAYRSVATLRFYVTDHVRRNLPDHRGSSARPFDKLRVTAVLSP
jgi:Uma2 family endonuclease